jgi:hypothetical protein
MSVFTKSKEAMPVLAGLDDLERRIPKVKNDPAYCLAGELLQKLAAEKAEIIGRLARGVIEDPCDAGAAKIRYDPAADAVDAEFLLRGEPLAGITAESQRLVLTRRLRALEMAIPAAEERQRLAWGRAIQEICSDIVPLLGEIVAEPFAAAAALSAALARKHAVCELLTRHGLREEFRPPALRMSGLETSLLFGDACRPSLSNFVGERK